MITEHGWRKGKVSTERVEVPERPGGEHALEALLELLGGQPPVGEVVLDELGEALAFLG